MMQQLDLTASQADIALDPLAGTEIGKLLNSAISTPDQTLPPNSVVVRFEVPGAPQGKGRPRAARRGEFIQLYTPEKTASYEGLIALVARQAMGGAVLLDGPVAARLVIRHAVPKSFSKKRQAAALAGLARPTTKPDADNVIKAVFDALNGVVWKDDTQVVELSARRFYAEVPGVSVEISPIGAAS